MKRDKKQPNITPPAHVSMPAAICRTLSNGVRSYTLDCSEQGVVRVSFVFAAGISRQQVPFSASAAANLLSEGTRSYTAQEIAEKLDFYGSWFDVGVDRDYAVITCCSLTKFFPQTLEIVREMLLYPLFAEEELVTYRAKRKQSLTLERTKVDFCVRELFGRSLFGAAHPYGMSSPESAYDNLTREDVAAFFRKYYVSENCFVVSSGQVGVAEQELIARLASELPAGVYPGEPVIPAAQPVRHAYLPFPDAVQSAVRIGSLLFPRMHPDYVGMQVVATILGGYFGSRLVRNLREEKGYTYGVYAAMVNLRESGYLAIATEVAAEATRDTIQQIFLELQRLRDEPVSDGELEMVKHIMAGEVMRVLDGPFGVADVAIENIQNGTDNAYLDSMLKQIGATTPQHVQELARRYLQPENFTVAVVGPVDPFTVK